MVWMSFLRMRGHVFKPCYDMAAELRKVPLEIFFNPTILSDGHLFSGFSDFFTPPLPPREGSFMVMKGGKEMTIEEFYLLEFTGAE
jgi:hypothetical protein